MTTRRQLPATDPRRWVDQHGNEIDETDRGLVYDLPTLVDRRRVLGLFGGDGLAEVPEETGGPYPADGSNGPNVLDDSGIVRSDIRSSFGSSATTAEGVPLRIRLTVRDAVTGENYLRGAQEAGADGTVAFTSIFPACYSGRWPHIHFEVYASLSDATSSGPIVKTSQITLPKEACEAVYALSRG